MTFIFSGVWMLLERPSLAGVTGKLTKIQGWRLAGSRIDSGAVWAVNDWYPVVLELIYISSNTNITTFSRVKVLQSPTGDLQRSKSETGSRDRQVLLSVGCNLRLWLKWMHLILMFYVTYKGLLISGVRSWWFLRALLNHGFSKSNFRSPQPG